MNETLEFLGEKGIIPVVKIERAEDSENLAEAFITGGLPLVEITFRTDAAEASIGKIKKRYPEMIVGAGTVLTIEQVKQAVGAGAGFIVAPGFNPRIVEYCLNSGITVIPGVNSASQIEIAMELGLEVLKFFPAEASGGINMIKSLSGPYGNISFIPTGGINISNLREYLDFRSVLACGGSWMAPAKLISDGNFDKIRELVREAVSEVLGFIMDRTNSSVVVKCNDLKRSAVFLRENGLDIEYNRDKEEIVINPNQDYLKIILRKGLN